MKTIQVIIIIALAYGCKNTTRPVAAAKKSTSVNTSINIHNAYSDLFLDSSSIEQFIAKQKPEENSINGIHDFYNARNFQFAWFNTSGLTEQALAFRSLFDYSKDSGATRKSLDNRLDSLMNADTLTVSAADAAIIKTELMLTWRFINYATEKYSNEATRKEAIEHLVPVVKQQVLSQAGMLAADNNLAITNAWYEALRNQLKKYTAYAKTGGWQAVTDDNLKYLSGANAPVIAQLKKRLKTTGQYSSDDTSSLYSPGFSKAVKRVQTSYGYTPDGIIKPELIKQLNIPVTTRIAQILVNMERMRWMPDQQKGRLIQVNIPEYKLHAWEDNTKAFDMNVVVGKQGHSTVMFSGNLNKILFSPYWNLPHDIVVKEVLPKMNKNRNYLKRMNMEVYGERAGVPVIRQLPGKKNELGKVKFLFPNSYDIYFHDTPDKWLFHKDARAYSHGCIRLSEPRKLSAYLLSDMPEWSLERMDSAMNGTTETDVTLHYPVPVLIYYYTAWVDEYGILQFRNDIYGHDEHMASRLFVNGWK